MRKEIFIRFDYTYCLMLHKKLVNVAWSVFRFFLLSRLTEKEKFNDKRKFQQNIFANYVLYKCVCSNTCN
jgi:hypothetical protein